ncbi:MAG: glycoside hydrolase family 3 C-terminal domain-containing protein [Clostridia bacterium]|nr:glycoside hydrolase family 3 C-terminal domain-containing protein [Clostridia bacterium]
MKTIPKDFSRFDDRVNELLAKMTLKEKIGQLNQASAPRNEADRVKQEEMMRRGEMGSLILATSATAGNCDQPAVDTEHYDRLQHIAVEESRLGIPMIFGRDVIHGHHTVFPIPLASACAFNPDLVTECYRTVAKEARAEGIHWTFSPMVDLCRDPRWGRIIEGPGEDPLVGATLAAAVVKGFQGEDLTAPDSMVACAKHFLGYGFSEGGRDYNHTEIPGYTLYNYVLPAFRAAVDAGCGTVMGSFNSVNGVPMAATPKYLTDLLRGDMGFEGFVVSDWGSIRQLIVEGIAPDLKECARRGVHAGIEMDMDLSCYADHLENLVNEGKVSMEVIDEAVRRVLRIKFACGLFDNPYTTRREVDKAPHRVMARKLAQESMILLKNNGVLPLEKNASIILGGAYADERRALNGSWSSDGHVTDVTTMTEAMTEVLSANGGTLVTVPSHPLYDNAPYTFFKNRGTIVLALGEGNLVTGEARSMARIEIAEDQVRIAREAHESGKKVVGVIFAGRPLALTPIEPYLDAILYAWHSGTESAHAACDILFGDVNPSGKAVVTFPRDTGHIPVYYNAIVPSKKVHTVYYGAGHGYQDVPCVPMYPFGFGLSYTKFDYSPVEVRRDGLTVDELKAGETVRVAVKVKNVGDRAGRETVQLYIHDLIASYVRPARELKAFRKIELAPGEEREIEFELGYRDLGYYDEDGRYLLEEGQFELWIGDDCTTTNGTRIKIV